MLLNSTAVAESITESDYSKRTQIGIDLSVSKVEKIIDGGKVLKSGTEISPDSSIDATFDENTSYREHMTFSSGNTLSQGDALIFVVRNTTGSINKPQLYGSLIAELHKT